MKLIFRGRNEETESESRVSMRLVWMAAGRKLRTLRPGSTWRATGNGKDKEGQVSVYICYVQIGSNPSPCDSLQNPNCKGPPIPAPNTPRAEENVSWKGRMLLSAMMQLSVRLLPMPVESQHTVTVETEGLEESVKFCYNNSFERH